MIRVFREDKANGVNGILTNREWAGRTTREVLGRIDMLFRKPSSSFGPLLGTLRNIGHLLRFQLVGSSALTPS
jgi:hypothetical protein